MEVVNLVISILSLIATIAISFVIYFLERKNQRLAEKQRIELEAKRFIMDNAEELDYLPWATVAAGCYPQNKHIRKIYNQFSYLDDETKDEVLKQRSLDCRLIENGDWIQEKISLIVEAIKELGIGNDFLYEGGKYFTRAYKYKKEDAHELELLTCTKDSYPDVFKLKRDFLQHPGKLTYTQYLEDFLYCKFEKPELMPKDVTLPNDYLFAVEDFRLGNEEHLCFWMMVMIDEVICYAIRYLNYDPAEPPFTDVEVKTYEDKYFSVLYRLYYLKKKQ